MLRDLAGRGAALREALAGGVGERVAAVGISGQMHSSVFLDAAGEVIRPALLWCDGRTTRECQEITTRAGGRKVCRVEGIAALHQSDFSRFNPPPANHANLGEIPSCSRLFASLAGQLHRSAASEAGRH